MNEGQVSAISYCDLRPPVRFLLRRFWRRYVNRVYRVSFRYPRRWKKVEDERYEGPGGFFQISVFSGGTISEVYRNEAFHKLMPYGSKPQIERFRLRGRRACLIFPAADQPQDINEQAALIVEYPKPVTIGGQAYNYFVLWAHRCYIRDMAGTLRFLGE